MLKEHRTMYAPEFFQITVTNFTPEDIRGIQRALDIKNPKFASLLRVSLSSVEAYRAPATSGRHRKPKGATLLLLCWLNSVAESGDTWCKAVQRVIWARRPIKKALTGGEHSDTG